MRADPGASRSLGSSISPNVKKSYQLISRRPLAGRHSLQEFFGRRGFGYARALRFLAYRQRYPDCYAAEVS